METARALRDAAVAFLDALGDGQRGIACVPFDEEDERRNWFYWPGERKGLAFASMSAEQRLAAYQVLSQSLSVPGYAKATSIIALEELLDRLEGGQGSRRGLRRDSSAYHTTIFGDPTGTAPWAWRFEGHHVSVHATFVDGGLAPLPHFLGANPAALDHGGRTVVRPLGEEEDVARELLHALPPDARDRALLSDEAPDDILTANAPQIDHDALFGDGVPFGSLTGDARELAAALVALYVERLPDDLAGREKARLEGGIHDEIRFAWCGDVERGGRHYYRLAGPRFLVEYDNTQNDANHVHTVWRDPEGDFGTDLLRDHLRAGHSSGLIS